MVNSPTPVYFDALELALGYWQVEGAFRVFEILDLDTVRMLSGSDSYFGEDVDKALPKFSYCPR
jgi:hypothetical protein